MIVKKLILCFLAVLFCVLSFTSGIFADGCAYSWYCVHVKDHAQPKADPSLAFVEDCGGYYIGRKDRDTQESEKVIYLTFDAGYENGNVARTLEILKEESVTGAFFILGNLIEKEPQLVKRMAEEGHTVCNHTMHHKNMTQMDREGFLQELSELEDAYQKVSDGELSPYYRPPEGRFTRENLEWAREKGYKTVFWSFAYPDWDNRKQMSPERAKQIVLDNAHDGEVMLLHPTSQTNASILQEVIQSLKEQGYRFGTLDELTGAAQYERSSEE